MILDDDESDKADTEDKAAAPTQDQPHTLCQSFRPSQDQTNQQDITSVELVPNSLHRPSDDSDDR